MVRSLYLTGDLSWVLPAEGFTDYQMCYCTDVRECSTNSIITKRLLRERYDLIVTVGWRHLVHHKVIDQTPLGVVGFHSAKLPEYPGRAPVPWAILRGDTVTHNTMLFLTDEPDAGDIIDHREVPVTTASDMNRRMGETAAEMLRQHLPALLAGTAPRTPQDRSRRGPLTKANGWQLLPEDRR
jgi:methionyl-tRNA formyltransferase